MQDDKRIIINPETDRRGEQGLAKVFGIVFWAVMMIGVLDHMLTVGWRMAASVGIRHCGAALLKIWLAGRIWE